MYRCQSEVLKQGFRVGCSWNRIPANLGQQQFAVCAAMVRTRFTRVHALLAVTALHAFFVAQTLPVQFVVHLCNRKACTAATVSMLPSALAECDGSYRFETANRGSGVFAWSHVSDERCTMLHDKRGNSVVTMESPVILAQASSAAAVARGNPVGKEWWADLVRSTETPSSLGTMASVVCTSAGQTTRIVFNLVESQQVADIPPVHAWNAAAEGVDGFMTPVSSRFKLTSRQDGSVVSSTHSSFHVSVSLAEDFWRSHKVDVGVPDFRLSKTDDGPAAKTSLRANITVNGYKGTASPGGVMIAGIGEGTNVFEICLFESHSDDDGKETRATNLDSCIAESKVIIEGFSAETHVIQQRYPSEVVASLGAAVEITAEGDEGVEPRRIIFITDLEVVDGIKLSTLHLIKHLPGTFQASALDLSCACERCARKKGIIVMNLLMLTPGSRNTTCTAVFQVSSARKRRTNDDTVATDTLERC